MLTPDRITELLRTYYTKKANSEARKFPIRGSATGHCPRKLSMLLAKKPTVPITFKAGRVFEDGHDRGVSLAKALCAERPSMTVGAFAEFEVWTTLPVRGCAEEMVIKASTEFPPTKDDLGSPLRVRQGKLQMRSHVDLMFRSGDSVHLIEFKGKNSYGMKKLDEEGCGVEYEMQVAAYQAGLEEAGFTVETAHLVFEDKDTQEWKPMAVPLKRANLKAVLEEIAGILDAWVLPGFSGEEGTPVCIPEDGGKLPWQCNYCAVGPKTGKCAPRFELIDRRKPGALMPAWEAL